MKRQVFKSFETKSYWYCNFEALHPSIMEHEINKNSLVPRSIYYQFNSAKKDTVIQSLQSTSLQQCVSRIGSRQKESMERVNAGYKAKN